MPNKIFIVVLACVCLGIYAGYLNNDFVFDDKILVEQNPLVKSLNLLPRVFKSGIYDYWLGPQGYDRMYRPLQMFSYFIDYRLWGNCPAGLRFTNLLLHYFNSILVFYLLGMFFKDRLLGQGAALLFLVHPVQISTVVYISSRADLLGGFFTLLTCILFLKFLDSAVVRLYYFSILAAGLALLSRENAVLIILFPALLSYSAGQLKSKYKVLTGFAVLSLMYLLMRFIIFGYGGWATHPVYLSRLWAAVNFCNIVFRYILLLFWPHNLHMLHTTPFIQKLSLPFAGLMITGLFVLAVVLISRRRKAGRFYPVSRFGLLWFLLGLLPAYFYFDAYSSLGGGLMAESWLYLPSIGFFAIIAYLCRLNKAGKFILWAAVFILAGVVLNQQPYWRSEVAFYERVTQFLPPDNIIQKNLAAAYIQSGSFKQAEQLINKLEKYYPDTPVVFSLRGQYYLAKGQARLALDYFDRILGKNFFTNYLVSLCYAKLENLKAAIEFSSASFSQNQLYRPNLIQLALLYQSAGRGELAQKYLVLARGLDPKAAVILK